MIPDVDSLFLSPIPTTVDQSDLLRSFETEDIKDFDFLDYN